MVHFTESWLPTGFFLPGDPLLFAAGLAAAVRLGEGDSVAGDALVRPGKAAALTVHEPVGIAI